MAERHPGLAGVRPPSRALLKRWLTDAGSPLQVVEPSSGGAYEAEVTAGRIPTREGIWHDAFNVLAFLAFPRAKPALHHRVHALQQARRQLGQRRRGREEDALTLLDEAVLIIAGPADGITRLQDVRRSGDVAGLESVLGAAGMIVTCFGHALLEHLVLERAPIGAGVLPLVLPAETPCTMAVVDETLAAAIAAGRFDRPRFGPSVAWPNDDVENWIVRSGG